MNLPLTFRFCHRKPGRSFSWKGRQFPVCARCTGIYAGYLSLPLFLFRAWIFDWRLALALVLPTALDGCRQAFFNRESTNWLRFVTGCAAGIGLMALSAITGQRVGSWLIHLIHHP